MTPGEVLSVFAKLLLEGLAVPQTNGAAAVMIAGPNGAGKSSAWKTMLSGLYDDAKSWTFINGDLIVREMVGDTVRLEDIPPKELENSQLDAQQIAQEERRLLIEARSPRSFVFETVFSDTNGSRLNEVRRAAANRFFTVVVAVCCDDIEVLIRRVAIRQSRGEHGVPEDRQRARYPRVRNNLRTVALEAGLMILLDNGRDSADAVSPQLRPYAVIRGGILQGCVVDPPQWVSEIISNLPCVPVDSDSQVH